MFDSHARNEACECDTPNECEAARQKAEAIDLPTGEELATLFARALARPHD